MSFEKSFPKDPDERKDYSIQWAAHLTGAETIASSVWVVDTGITVATTTTSATATTIWLEGGTSGTNYKVINRITTTSSPARILEKAIQIRVKSN
jgi:hypothetical protein